MASERALSSDELAEFNALLPDAYQLLGLQAAPQPSDSAQVVGHIDRTVDRLRRQQIPALQELPWTALYVGTGHGLNRRYPSRSSISRWNKRTTLPSP